MCMFETHVLHWYGLSKIQYNGTSKLQFSCSNWLSSYRIIQLRSMRFCNLYMLISFFLHFRQKYDNSSYRVIALTSSIVSHQCQWFYCCSNFDVIYQFFCHNLQYLSFFHIPFVFNQTPFKHLNRVHVFWLSVSQAAYSFLSEYRIRKPPASVCSSLIHFLIWWSESSIRL